MTAPLQSRRGPLADPVVRMIVTHWALGAGVGALAAALIFALDIAYLRTMMIRSDLLFPGLMLLFTGFAVTFGGVVSATAVMFNPVAEDRARGKGEMS